MKQPELPTLAAAEIATQRGDAVRLGRLIRLTDGAIPELAPIIFAMLAVPDDAIPEMLKPCFVPIDPDVYADRLGLKWRLTVERYGRGRPRRGESSKAVRVRCLDLLRRRPVVALRLIAGLLDPPTGSVWRLVFRRVVLSHKRGRPAADEATRQLIDMATVQSVNIVQEAGTKTLKRAILSAGTKPRTFYRAKNKLAGQSKKELPENPN
jgi:hypothetical protein